jgi:hypothetical protein
MKLIPSRALIVVGAALALGIGGGVAVAQIPSGGQLTACYVKSTGVVRIIDADTTNCKKGETQIVWTQAGQDGADGADGADGVSGYERVATTISRAITGSTLTEDFTISCPGDKVVTGGGGGGSVAVVGEVSHPLVTGGGFAEANSSWTIDLQKPDGSPFVDGETVTAFVQAICVNALP